MSIVNKKEFDSYSSVFTGTTLGPVPHKGSIDLFVEFLQLSEDYTVSIFDKFLTHFGTYTGFFNFQLVGRKVPFEKRRIGIAIKRIQSSYCATEPDSDNVTYLFVAVLGYISKIPAPRL